MKKIFFMAAVAALALSSCSSTEEVLNAPAEVAENAIGFDVYTGRTVSRAAGDAITAPTKIYQYQALDGNSLRCANVGFGVFAYSTGSTELESYVVNNTFPNFMFNQLVKGEEEKEEAEFAYSPVKYWPNEEGDLLSFQAFAPYQYMTKEYVAAILDPNGDDNHDDDKPEELAKYAKVADNAVFGKQYNGVGIRYEYPTNQYDLMWGAKKVGSAEPYTYSSYANEKKPAVTDTYKFTFVHALSKVDVKVQLLVDEFCTVVDGTAGKDVPTATPDYSVPADKDKEWTALHEGTEVKINYVKLLGQVPTKGVLSLYDGSWTVESMAEDVYTFTTKDFVNAYTDEAKAKAFDADYTGGLFENGVFIGTETKEKKLPAWVGPKNGWMVIPFDDSENHSEVYVEISYDVKTVDENDAHNTSVVTNTIKKPVALTIAKNTHTILNIHVGLTSAWFDAEVEDWTAEGDATVHVPATDNIKPEP